LGSRAENEFQWRFHFARRSGIIRPPMTTVAGPSPLHVTSRVAASLVGGYAFVWGFVTLGVALAVAAGMPYEEAEQLLFLLAFLVYLVCFCWALSARSLALVWIVLAGGGALFTTAGWLWGRALG
jgi:membrane protein DedA with SNARE-associated domain